MRCSLFDSLIVLTPYEEKLGERSEEGPPATTRGISRDYVGAPQASQLGKYFLPNRPGISQSELEALILGKYSVSLWETLVG